MAMGTTAPFTEAAMNEPGYELLANVLRRAYDQAARGKGKERHAGGGLAYDEQPMALINRNLGSIDGYLFQATKKAMEARRLPSGRAQAELLGAINYLAGAVIALDSWAAGTLPQPEPASLGTPSMLGPGTHIGDTVPRHETTAGGWLGRD